MNSSERISRFLKTGFFAMTAVLGLVSGGNNAHALELDWSGQFRVDNHFVHNYSLDASGNLLADPTRLAAGGYYIPGGGARDANFQTLFMRLRPKVVVNDNVYIKSEFWFGNPIFGFFGDAAPYSYDQRQYYSNQSRGSVVTAQRFWAEVLTDVGTVQVGRTPLHWGLGVFWNSGDGLWDRYMSTGDSIRLISKFGAFSLIPSAVKYSAGNNIGGACNTNGTGVCTPVNGGGGVSDYSIIFKYENPDDDLEGGVNFVKRLMGPAQDTAFGFQGPGPATGATSVPAGSNYNLWDLYARKRFGKFTLGAEVPITSGDVGGLPYKTFAAAFETDWRVTDAWQFSLRAGHAPGQPNFAAGAARPSEYKPFYFNPGYKLGLIMFNYQLRNFAGPNTLNAPSLSPASLASPFDNPIVNANYLTLGGGFSTDKWNFHGGFVYARAIEAAANGQNFFNTWERRFVTATKDQAKSLGWEMDYGTTFTWDENFQVGLDLGWWFPGDFFKFSNSPTDNTTATVFSTVVRAGVSF